MSADGGPRVEYLAITGDLDAWRAIGLTVADDGLVPLFGASLRVTPPSEAAGPTVPHGAISGWGLSGVTAPPESIDGLTTEVVESRAPVYADHPLGATAIDHVVVTTPDLERTSTAIAGATGCELKRIRDLGSMRQGFHRIGRGGLIVELVERPDIEPGPANFWGLVLIVDDLDAACATIGSRLIGGPKDAVQPGRRIATVRDDAGLGVPLALMTPDSR
jgi:hypothetical protein